MFQVYETNSGKRRLVTCSEKLATKMLNGLLLRGIKAFMVKT